MELSLEKKKKKEIMGAEAGFDYDGSVPTELGSFLSP